MKDRFLNSTEQYERLKSEYDRYGQLIIAFDYDNTVYDYYRKGDTYPNMTELLQQLKEIGCHLICFTSCDDSRHQEIHEYLETNGVPYDSINETPDWIPFHGRKVYYNALLDDRAGLGQVFDTLQKLYYVVQGEKRKLLKDIEF